MSRLNLPSQKLYKQLRFAIIVFLITLKPFIASSQTTLAPGDLAILQFASGASGNDFIRILTLKEMSCGTQFIVTDNNWRTSTGTWYCAGDEFGVQFTTTSIIPAGTTIYLEVNPIGAPSVSPFGSFTFANIGTGSTFGTNVGFNSGGDNAFILQGTYASPSFIYGLKNNGTFASQGDCSSKDGTGLPPGLVLGTSAIEMTSGQGYWQYKTGVLNAGTQAALLASIGNNANWTTSGPTAQSFSVTGAPYNPTGALVVSGAGCGCQAGCDLTSIGGPNCGAGQTGNCTAGSLTVTTDVTVPSGCTYIVSATTRLWSGAPYNCGSGSGADSDNKLKVDLPAGAKALQTGASDGEIDDFYQLTGPGTIRVTGIMNRADEVVLYRVISSPCSSCGIFVLPIELSKFNASLQDKNVVLRWTTETEVGNDFFTIERTADAETWETVSIVKGFGNSHSQLNYSVLDSSPLKGISYYRLKQTDYDGRYSYSDIVSIENNVNDENRKIVKRVNMYGQEVDENATGLLILVYDNGDVKKVYKN